MKKPWFPYLVKKIWPFSGIVARVGLIAAVFVGLFLFPAQAHAARTITSATLNGGSSVTVAPSAPITAAVNVTTTGTGTAARWRSTGWRIATAPGAVTCVNHANHDGAGAYSETFSITAPVTSGTYNAYFIAYNNDSCSSGASATRTMTGAVVVTVTNPVPTTTSISPASKNVGDGAFTMTVNGTNFVSGSVVRFNGFDRTTTYVSATQLTAAIPASDMTAAGTFNITVVNPTPGGGTSNAQTFTVTTAFPTATTNAASGVTTPNGTSWSATLNGIVSSNGAITDVTFEYGTTTAYGLTTPNPIANPLDLPITLAAGAVNAAVSADLIGLNCNTLFHYRVKATNSAGTSYGLDSTFTTGSCPSAPFAATDCAAARFGSNLVCAANDVNLTGIVLAPTVPVQQSSCVSGTPVTLDIDMTVNFATPDRWDVGIFIANDGKLPTQLPANGGASSCSVDVLPITPPAYGYTFPDLDGEPMGTSDICGDGNSAINGGTGSGVKRMTGVTLPCNASADSGGKLFVPFVVSWDNQKSPIGGLCTSNQYPVPNTTSKCNAPLSSVAIEVVVLPKIIKTHSGATFNNGSQIIYTITVFNDSGGTLQASFFKDPVVTGLAVTGLSCAAANGATCPTTNNTVADMQGPTGIPIPSAYLPNNSSLIFTVTGTLSGCDGISCSPLTTISNTATVSIGPNTNSSTDSVTLGSASGSKSFAPAAITEGNNSLMTITFTNPTAFDVTGVSFIDTYPSGLVNAASPNVSTTCGGTVTAIAGGLTFSGGIIPASGSCTVSVYVTSATANNYINSVSFLPGSLGSASATLTVNAVTVGAFNAFESATAAGAITGVIYTKIAGTSFDLDVVAIKHGAQDNSFSKIVKVELLCNTGSYLDVNNCPTSSALLQTVTPPALSNGRGPVNFAVSDACKDVRVKITYPASPPPPSQTISCSTDSFAIRPAAFLVTQNTPTLNAGSTFTLQAAAVVKSDLTTVTTNYTATPTLNLGQITGTPGFTSEALLPNVFPAATNGVSSNTFTYDDVGSFTLPANSPGTYGISDSTFTSVDGSSDCIVNSASNTPDASNKIGCLIGQSAALTVGTFYPDHFEILPSFTAGCAIGGFTYMDQPFTLGYIVTARSLSRASPNPPGNVALKLYSGGKLNLAAINGSTDWVARLSPAVTNPLSPTWSNGSYTPAITSYTFTRPITTPADATWGAFDTLNIGVAIDDADGIGYSAGTSAFIGATPASCMKSGASECRKYASLTEGVPTKMRYGRVKLSNAYGSELLQLTIPIALQYYTSNGWVPNTEDTCSVISAGNFAFSFPGNNLAACETAMTVNGSAPSYTLKLAAPGSGNNGWTDLTLNLGNSGTTPLGGTCTAINAEGFTGADTPANAPWLQFPTGANPTARATFGVYKGNNQFIYLREMY